MLTQNDLLRAKACVEEFALEPVRGNIILKDENENRITKTETGYELSARTFPILCRELLEILKVQKGMKREAMITDPVFENCGCMLDCSRAAVAKVETVKKLIRYSAACGLNLLMLYMEDTFEIPEQPYFGYMRGRYSLEELRELDAYALSYGIELEPCIETLSHLGTFLTFNGAEIRDTKGTLLCGEEKTYEFIEQAVRACRSAFSSKHIDIGMDEAGDLGRGQYLDKHGVCDQHEVMCEHLKRVIEICRRYDFEPMTWSDMFFCNASPSGSYYDVNTVFTPEMAAKIPDCTMGYWDYYHEDKALYDGMIRCHQQMKKPLWFAGGASTWYGLLPRWTCADIATRAALCSCIEHGVTHVVNTMWGDDGNDCNLAFDYPYIAMFAEYHYGGLNTKEANLNDTITLLCGYGTKEAEILGSLDMRVDGTDWNTFSSKRLLFTDPLYEFGMEKRHTSIAGAYYEEKCRQIDEIRVREDARPLVELAKIFYHTVSDKLCLINSLRPAYQSGDRGQLGKIADELLPRLINEYDLQEKELRKKWMATYKPFGFEVQCYRYGGVIQRLKMIRETIHAYLDGSLSKIAELEETVLDTKGRYYYPAVSTAFV